MKKNISVIAALALATSMIGSMSAFAGIDPDTQDQYQDVTVTKTVAATYMVTIPDTDLGDEDTIKISAANVMLNPNENLTVMVASANQFEAVNKADATAKIAYGLYTTVDGGEDQEFVTTDPVISVAHGGAERTLKVKFTGTPTSAGTYEDTLTFTVAVD